MTLKKETVSRNFGRYASHYEDNARLQLRVANELISQCQHFNGKVLDLGAGPGIIRKYTDWKVTELDISFEMCKQSAAATVNGDIETMPFKSESFPFVISSLSMQWVNFPKALKEIHRVLKPGGKFSFTTFSPNSLRDLKAAYSYIDQAEHLMNFEPVMRLFAMLKKAGFTNLTVSSQAITYYYSNIISALNSIKHIGASYGYSNSKKGLRTRKYFDQLENTYKNICKQGDRIPLNWEVLYIHTEKA